MDIEKRKTCTIKHFCGISMVATGFSRKKLYLLRISIFLKLTPWISSQIYRDPPPGIFHFFALTPLEIHFFPQFLVYPLEFQRLNSTPWNFSVNILNWGVTFFFWKIPSQFQIPRKSYRALKTVIINTHFKSNRLYSMSIFVEYFQFAHLLVYP